MFRWLRERRQKKAAERRAQLRDKVQTGGLAGARKQMRYYSESAEAPQQNTSDSVAQNFAMQLIAQEMARDLSDSRDSGQRQHVTQVHHGSGDNIAGSTSHGHNSHSSHDYSGSHHSSHDSGSYDSGSSSSGSDSSW